MHAYILQVPMLKIWQSYAKFPYKLWGKGRGYIILMDQPLSLNIINRFCLLPVSIEFKKVQSMKSGEKVSISYLPNEIPSSILFSAKFSQGKWEITLLEDTEFPLESPSIHFKSLEQAEAEYKQFQQLQTQIKA